MRLMRIGDVGRERPAVDVDGEHYVDISDVVPTFDEAFFAGGASTGSAEVVAAAGRRRSQVGALRRSAHRAAPSSDRTRSSASG